MKLKINQFASPARYQNLDTAAAIPNLLELNVDAVVKEFQKEKQ